MTRPDNSTDGPTRMPGWFKLFGGLGLAVIAVVVVLHLTGHMTHMHDMS